MKKLLLAVTLSISIFNLKGLEDHPTEKEILDQARALVKERGKNRILISRLDMSLGYLRLYLDRQERATARFNTPGVIDTMFKDMEYYYLTLPKYENSYKEQLRKEGIKLKDDEIKKLLNFNALILNYIKKLYQEKINSSPYDPYSTKNIASFFKSADDFVYSLREILYEQPTKLSKLISAIRSKL